MKTTPVLLLTGYLGSGKTTLVRTNKAEIGETLQSGIPKAVLQMTLWIQRKMLFLAQLLQGGKSEVLLFRNAAFKRHDIVGANQVAEIFQRGRTVGVFNADINSF